MNPWLAGLGAGLQSIGGSALQILAQEQARKEREAERTRQQKLQDDAIARANRQYDQSVAQFVFQNNLTPMEAVEAPVKRAEEIGSTFSSFRGAELPGAMGVMLGDTGDALSQLAQKSRAQMARGRSIDVMDSSGKSRTYYQPYEKTPEGIAERDRTRGIKALTDAGYSLEEATAVYNSPENLRSAILERIRPLPKGQPDKIIENDGSVAYYQPPTMKPGEIVRPGLTQRQPPAAGSTPYNSQVITDPGTGRMYLVDPRTGQVRPTQAPDGAGPFQTTTKEQTEQERARERLLRAVTRARELVNEIGIEVMPGVAQDQLSAAFTALQLQYKDAAGLGALTGPDMGLIEKALGDPTSFTQLLRGGKAGVLAKLAEAENALAKPAGAAPPAGGGGAMQLTPQEQAIYDAAKRENKSDAEIMAFIQKLRGGR